jgi:hypothetical protein
MLDTPRFHRCIISAAELRGMQANGMTYSFRKNMAEKMEGREVIFEFTPVGNLMRISAMDVATMTEISLQAPLNAGEAVMKKNALMRLEYVLRKEGKIT